MTQQSTELGLAERLINAAPRALAAGGAVFLSTLAMGGNALGARPVKFDGAEAKLVPEEIFDAPTLLQPAGLFNPTAQAAANPRCNYLGGSADCYWEVSNVESLPGSDQHPWNDCIGFAKSRLQQQITCSIAKATADTVTADVGGQFPAGIGAISTAVHYSITKTTTFTTGDTVTVPANTAGVVQWAGVFGSLDKVTQQYEECYETSPGIYNLCVPNSHANATHLRYAYTEKFSHPIFRVLVQQ